MNLQELFKQIDALLLKQEQLTIEHKEVLMTIQVCTLLGYGPVWLDRHGVMDFKGYSERVFYYRLKENKGIWIREKRDGVWHYLKSSL